MSLTKRYIRALLRTIVLIIPLLIIGWFIGNRFFQKKGYTGTNDFFLSVFKEVGHSFTAEIDDVQLLVDNKDLMFLEDRVSKAKARGIHTNKGGDNFVDGKLIFKGDTLPVKLRLKGHMLDHFQGNKWSFRIKTKENTNFRGLSAFTFQHPGTRGYINEWVYHELARQEGIIALKYDFFKLHLNGKNLGIYALEEHFGQELALSNKKTEGCFLRWNPNLYWEGRLDEKDKIDFTKHQYTDFSASFVDPYDEGEILKNPVLYENFLHAAVMLEELRRGTKTTSEVFDIQKLATLHAIIDLVGGHHSLDWSDVKYYYNSISGKIEPVAYESFSVNPVKILAGQRALSIKNNQLFNIHDILFNDMEFYAAYISELERLSEAKFLNDFFAAVEPKLLKKSAILATEFPYKRFNKELYYENQTRIRKLLAAPLGFHAHLRKIEGNKLVLDLANIHEFPFEILSAKCNGEKIKVKNTYLQPKLRNLPLTYHKIELVFDQNLENKGKKNKIELKYCIPGSLQKKELDVNLIPAFTALEKTDQEKTDLWPDFLIKDEINKRVLARQGEWSLNYILTIPEGWDLIINSPFALNMEANSGIIASGNVEIKGTLDNPVYFIGPDSGAAFIEFNEAAVILKHVVLENLRGHTKNTRQQAALNIIGGRLNAENCDFIGNDKNDTGIFAHKSVLNFKKNHFSQWKSMGEIEFSTIKLHNVLCKKSKHGWSLTGCVFNAGELEFKKVKNPLHFHLHTNAKLEKVKIEKAVHAIISESNSVVLIKDFSGNDIELCFQTGKNNPLENKTSITAEKVNCSDCKEIKKTAHGTEILLD